MVSIENFAKQFFRSTTEAFVHRNKATGLQAHIQGEYKRYAQAKLNEVGYEVRGYLPNLKLNESHQTFLKRLKRMK